MSDRTPRPSYAELAASRSRGGDFLAPGALRSGRPHQPRPETREATVPFFADIARFAIKGLIVIALLFFATLAVVAALVIGGSSGGGDEFAGESSSAADGFTRVVRGELNDDEDNKLAIIPITGLIDSLSISDSNPVGWFDFVTYGYSIKETLADLAEDETIKGVLLLMNTPGGTINGSIAIADGVKAYQEATNQPVFAYVQAISASGGMWSMAGADRIIADEGSLVGSIGVILGSLMYYDDPIAVDEGVWFGGVETRGGIQSTTLAAGEGKDFGNPYRKASDAELAAYQANLEDLYDLFRAHVSEERGLSDAQVRALGAMVYSPRRAQEFGLVDEVADFDAALAALAEQAGIGEDFAAVQRSFGDVPWFGGFIQALGGDTVRPHAAAPAAPPGVSVCNRAEPLVLSDFYARPYPGC